MFFFCFFFLYFLASALCLFWVMGVVPYTKHHDSISVVWVWVGTLQSARVSLRFLVRYRNSKPPMRSGFFPPKLELYFFDFSGTWTSCSDGTWRALIVLKNYCRPKRLHWVGRHKMKSNFQSFVVNYTLAKVWRFLTRSLLESFMKNTKPNNVWGLNLKVNFSVRRHFVDLVAPFLVNFQIVNTIECLQSVKFTIAYPC